MIFDPQTALDRLANKISVAVAVTVVLSAVITMFAWAIEAPTWLWWVDGLIVGITVGVIGHQVGFLLGRRHGRITEAEYDEDGDPIR